MVLTSKKREQKKPQNRENTKIVRKKPQKREKKEKTKNNRWNKKECGGKPQIGKFKGKT